MQKGVHAIGCDIRNRMGLTPGVAIRKGTPGALARNGNSIERLFAMNFIEYFVFVGLPQNAQENQRRASNKSKKILGFFKFSASQS